MWHSLLETLVYVLLTAGELVAPVAGMAWLCNYHTDPDQLITYLPVVSVVMIWLIQVMLIGILQQMMTTWVIWLLIVFAGLTLLVWIVATFKDAFSVFMALVIVLGSMFCTWCKNAVYNLMTDRHRSGWLYSYRTPRTFFDVQGKLALVIWFLVGLPGWGWCLLAIHQNAAPNHPINHRLDHINQMQTLTLVVCGLSSLINWVTSTFCSPNWPDLNLMLCVSDFWIRWMAIYTVTSLIMPMAEQYPYLYQLALVEILILAAGFYPTLWWMCRLFSFRVEITSASWPTYDSISPRDPLARGDSLTKGLGLSRNGHTPILY